MTIKLFKKIWERKLVIIETTFMILLSIDIIYSLISKDFEKTFWKLCFFVMYTMFIILTHRYSKLIENFKSVNLEKSRDGAQKIKLSIFRWTEEFPDGYDDVDIGEFNNGNEIDLSPDEAMRLMRYIKNSIDEKENITLRIDE